MCRTLFAVGVAVLAGCADNAATDPGSEKLPSPDARQQSDSSSAAAGPVADETEYDGLTLDQWRERINQIRYGEPETAELVPGLLQIVCDRDVPWYSRRQAALTLGRIGEPARQAVPVLVELLQESVSNGDATTQLWSLRALALFGPVAAEATPALVGILESEDVPHLARISTLEALGRIGPDHPGTLPPVIRTLQLPRTADEADEQHRLELRVAAAEVLELYRGNAALAVPALMAATTDDSVLLRRAAVNTLGVIGQSAEPALPALADRLLFDESEDVRDLAAIAMAGIGPSAEPYLAQLLADPEESVRRRALVALGQMERLDESTQTLMRERLVSESADVRLLAAAALWNVTRDAETVIATVVADLGHRDRELRMQAVQLVEQIGPTPEFGGNELQLLIEGDDPLLRQAARRILRTWNSDRAVDEG